MAGWGAMRGFHQLMTVSSVLEKLRGSLRPAQLDHEETTLIEALGRYAAEDVKCPQDLPGFDRAAVDGFAIHAEDSFGASPTNPIELRVVGRVEAGASPDTVPTISRGEAVLIFTGAPLPRGADAVLMAEHCTQLGEVVQVRRQVRPTENVSRRGEDYMAGETIIRRGTRLKPWHIAALASTGRSRVRVLRRLRVGILSTGSELVEPGQSPAPGQVVNSSKPMLICLAIQEGCEPVDLGTLPDDIDLIRSRLSEGLGRCDTIITTGGSSVGEKDLVPEAVSGLPGARFIAHGIRMRPGRPTGVAIAAQKPIFLLSGFPVAALAGFDALVRPTIHYLRGTRPEPQATVRGVLSRRVSNHAGTRSYLRVRVLATPDGCLVEPLMLTGSGLLSTLTKANGLLVMDEATEGYDEGQVVEVQLIDNLLHANGDADEFL